MYVHSGTDGSLTLSSRIVAFSPGSSLSPAVALSMSGEELHNVSGTVSLATFNSSNSPSLLCKKTLLSLNCRQKKDTITTLRHLWWVHDYKLEHILLVTFSGSSAYADSPGFIALKVSWANLGASVKTQRF